MKKVRTKKLWGAASATAFSVVLLHSATSSSVLAESSIDSGPDTLERAQFYLKNESMMGPARHFMAANAGTDLSVEMINEFSSILIADQAVLNHEQGFDSDPSRTAVSWNGAGFNISENAKPDIPSVHINGFQSSVGTPVSGWCSGNSDTGFDTPLNKHDALQSCYQKFKIPDASKDEDLWAYSRWVKADPLDNGSWNTQSANVKQLYVYARVTSGSAHKVLRRFDVSPDRDENKGCDSVPITVVLGVVEVGQTLTWCDDWDINSWAQRGKDSAKYRNRFKASGKMAFLGRRAGKYQEVGFTNAIWVKDGTEPYFYDYSSAELCQYYNLSGWQDCHYDNWDG